jgi:transcriptional antiterminator NusG
MTNTYAINTTRGKEFEVEAEIRAMGLKPWTPRRLDSRRIKEKSETVWYDRPYVGKLLFCVVPAIYWRDVHDLKHVIGKPVQLSRLDIEGQPAHKKKYDPDGALFPAVPGLKDFKAAVEAEYADTERRRANNEYQCQYAPGQALELLAGTFEGFPATFKDVVQRAHDEYAKLRVSVEFFGRETTLEVDPNKVKVA